MKKQKKKLTPSQKKELKAKIKRLCLGALHVLSYILSVLFILVCVIAGVQSCRGKPQKVNTQPQENSALVMPQKNEVINRDESPIKYEDLQRYFYPSDIQLGKHIVNLNFSNYNYLEYFLPNYTDLKRFSSTTDTIIQNIGLNTLQTRFNIKTYVNGEATNGLIYEGQVITDQLAIFVNSAFVYVGLTMSTDSTATMYYGLYTFTYNDSFSLASDTRLQNDFNISIYDLFDFVFTSQSVEISLVSGANNNQKEVARYFYYYCSLNSFDYNGYMFGGIDKYVSFMNLFRRVYNGFFIYYPGATDLFYSFDLFAGVWEYKNIIYNRINITLQRAWNGSLTYDGSNIDYEITYYSPNNTIWFNDIFYGDNPALTNYYFINNIEMVSVYGDSITLAYNRVNNTHLEGLTDYTARVYPSTNIRLWQDDSFINNNNIQFVLYSIKYYYDFIPNNNVFIIYKAYSDFFFSAFYYTGLYNTNKPGSSDGSINIFSPVFVILASALTGILPLLNAYLLPGVSIGTLLLLPFVVSIILFVVKLFKR